MHGLLEGKVAVITGAGSGVGRAAVKLWTENGAKVVAADINEANAKETAEMVGGDVRAIRCDVSDPASIQAAIDLAVKEFGKLDVIYNNAGITINPQPGGLRRLVDAPLDEMKRVEDVNINGVIYGCQAAIRQFEKQGTPGAIVNTASVSGLIGYGGVVYGATKAAVVGLTRTLAIEISDQGIRINSVCPAGMLTHYSGMNPDSEHREAMLEGMGKHHPLGRAIDPADTAAAAMFLASDLAKNITGVNLPVDGGLTAGQKIRAGG